MELSRAHTHIQQRKSEKDIRSLELKFQAVIHRVSSGTWTQVLCESRKCPYPFNHCYSPILLNLLFPSSTWKLPISLNPPRSGYLSPFHFIYIWNHPLVFQVFFYLSLLKSLIWQTALWVKSLTSSEYSAQASCPHSRCREVIVQLMTGVYFWNMVCCVVSEKPVLQSP